MNPFRNRGGGKPSQSQRSHPPPNPPPQARAPTSISQQGQSLDAIRQSQLYQQHLAHHQQLELCENCDLCNYVSAPPTSQEPQQTPFLLSDAQNFPTFYNAALNPALSMNPVPLFSLREGSISEDQSMVTLDIPGGGTQTYALGEPVAILDLLAQSETGNVSGYGGTSGDGAGATVDIGGVPGVQLPSPPPYPFKRGDGGDVQSRRVQKLQNHTTSDSRESTVSETPYLHDEMTVFKAASNEVSVKSEGIHAAGGSCNVIPKGQCKVNRDDPKNVKKFLDHKYSFQFLKRIEIRAIIGTGSDKNKIDKALWEVYVKQDPVKEFVTRIKPKKTEFCLNLLTGWFKEMCRLNMKVCKCWLPTDQTCVLALLYPKDICSVHYRGTEEERNAEIQEQVDIKFAPKILKFVVGRDRELGKHFLGIVTDPEKLGVNDFVTKNFWYVSKPIVQNILENLTNFELGGYFCEG